MSEGRELFGTDGVRGLAGKYPLDPVGAMKIGMAVGTHFAKPGQRIVLGNDPRESSAGLVKALIEGLTAVGVHVTQVGIIPTPGLAYLTREGRDFTAGIMITASHNPYKYNGVKVFDKNGGKLTDKTETILNKLIVQGTPERTAGKSSADNGLVRAYEDFLVNSAEGYKLADLSLAVDSANGAASGLAARVFTRLEAQVTALFNQPDGRNINQGCGATNTDALSQKVVYDQLELGVALDGDADRLMLIDEQGRQVNGDHILYILAVAGGLQGVVLTAMSNLGVENALKARTIDVKRVGVGDRYVLEGLRDSGYSLGGEQSGHIILADRLATGDALLAAIRTLAAVKASGKSLAEWRDEVPMLPQTLINIPLVDKSLLEKPEVAAYIKQETQDLGDKGRLLIRPSGTEPLARVMVEAADAGQRADRIASRLAELL